MDSSFRYLCIYSGIDFYFLFEKAQPLKIDKHFSTTEVGAHTSLHLEKGIFFNLTNWGGGLSILNILLKRSWSRYNIICSITIYRNYLEFGKRGMFIVKTISTYSTKLFIYKRKNPQFLFMVFL